MAFRFVNMAGSAIEPAVVSMFASGTVHPGEVVEFSRSSGVGVTPASMNSTVTNIFGVCLDYAQGASDTQVRVIPFAQGQVWEADCVLAAATAQIGFPVGIDRARANLALYNATVDSTTSTAIFRIIAITGSTSGSGKVLGYFRRGVDSNPDNTTIASLLVY